LLDRVGKLKIESVFGNAARADGARHLDGVAHIHHGAKGRALTDRGLRERSMPCAARGMSPGTEQQHREDDERSRCGAPESAHDTPRGFAGVADTMMASRGP
jgi:hypothetical protein